MYRAGSAERHATSKLRAGHVQGVAQHPKQRHLGADVDSLRLAVQYKTDGHDSPDTKIRPDTNRFAKWEYPTTILPIPAQPLKIIEAAPPGCWVPVRPL